MSDTFKRPLPPGFPIPRQETERLLIERLQSSKTEEDYFRWLLFVVAFYRGIEKPDCAKTLLESFLATSADPNHRAHCHLALGQIATDEQALETALHHFHTALKLDPKKKKILYVLHNNTGYCFNRLGRFTEAERHCRLALGLDSKRASAYRNLGVSLEGQGDVVGAAWALIEAIKADPKDGRARDLLENLALEHPEVALRCPWVEDALSPDGTCPDDNSCI